MVVESLFDPCFTDWDKRDDDGGLLSIFRIAGKNLKIPIPDFFFEDWNKRHEPAIDPNCKKRDKILKTKKVLTIEEVFYLPISTNNILKYVTVLEYCSRSAKLPKNFDRWDFGTPTCVTVAYNYASVLLEKHSSTIYKLPREVLAAPSYSDVKGCETVAKKFMHKIIECNKFQHWDVPKYENSKNPIVLDYCGKTHYVPKTFTDWYIEMDNGLPVILEIVKWAVPKHFDNWDFEHNGVSVLREAAYYHPELPRILGNEVLYKRDSNGVIVASSYARITREVRFHPKHLAKSSRMIKLPHDLLSEPVNINYPDYLKVAHHAAGAGNTRGFTKEDWLISTSWGYTAAHAAAFEGNLTVAENSKMWRVRDHLGVTPAHYAAMSGNLKFSNDSPLWRLRDKDGNTPAHEAAKRGKLPEGFPYLNLKNKDGTTVEMLLATNVLKNLGH